MPRSERFVPLGGCEDGSNRIDLPDLDAVCDACARAIEASSTQKAQETFCAGVEACIVQLEEILRLVRERVARIPVPQGFFARDTERAAAYAESCRLLLRLDSVMTAFRAAFTALCAAEKHVYDAEKHRAESGRMLFLLGERYGNSEGAAPDMAVLKDTWARLEQEAERGGAILRAVCDLRRDVLPWMREMYPHFCEQLSRAVDMEHEGASCDPHGARRLCAELADATDARLRSFTRMKQIESV